MNVSGQWEIDQTNGFRVVVNIKQPQPQGPIAGTASHSDGTVTGQGHGSVNGGHFVFEIRWNNETAGLYSGVRDASGVLHGSSFDILHPSSVAGWNSSKAFQG